MTEWFPDFSEQITEDSDIQNNDEFYEKVKQQIEPYVTFNKETNHFVYKNDNIYSQTIAEDSMEKVI